MLKPGKYDPMKPDIELLDYKSKKKYGLKLSGSGALQIGTISQDDSVFVRNVAKRVGDFDEQRNWKDGRGAENLSEHPEGFWDSQNMWTMADGHLHQTLLWKFARGLRSCDVFMPDNTHSLTWKQLLGTSKYISMSWSSSGFTAAYARLWIRRIGTPGTLTVTLCDDSAGSPGTTIASATVTVSTVTDFISVLQKFSVTGTLSASTTYHLKMVGDTNDNKNNHWEIGCYDGGTTGKVSTNGSSWTAAGFDAFYYVADADISRTWFPFFLDSTMYIVDKKDDGSLSKLYINGDRAQATSGGATSIVDSTKSWVTNRWVGAWVRIVRGTGIGQSRQILSNTNTTLTVSGWTTQPDQTSEFVIYATDWFTNIADAGMGCVVSQPLVINQIVYFPKGDAANIRRMVWNPSTNVHVFADDSTNKASFLISSMDGNSLKVWRVINTTGSGGAVTASFATAASWAAAPTALAFGTAKNIGGATYRATGVEEKDGLIYIFKENGTWIIDGNMVITHLQSGAEKTPDSHNGVAHLIHQTFIYSTWMHSMIRIFGTSHDDVGQDWSGYGLPEGREGYFSCLDSYTSLLIAAVDAGTGTSSVLGFDGIGFHELIRAYDAGLRIRMVKVQPNIETRNRMWVDMGGDLVYQEMPFMKGSPRLDSGCRFMHEGVIESSAIDMGTASGLPKFIKEIVVSCDNLGNGNEIHVDYQFDDDVHTSKWTEATTLFESPEAVATLNLSNVRKFAYRLRVHSSDNTKPVDIRGVVPNGYARTPYKMVWTLRCQSDSITSKGRFVKPDELMRWLLDNARFPGKIEMHSQYQLAHNFAVIVHPPRMFPYQPAANGQPEQAVFTLVLEEI